MSDMQNIAAAFENTQDSDVKNHLRLALQTMMRNACGMVRRKKVDPNKLTAAEIRAGENQGKISCIKMYRERLSCGLREAKDQVELQFDRLGKKFYGY